MVLVTNLGAEIAPDLSNCGPSRQIGAAVAPEPRQNVMTAQPPHAFDDALDTAAKGDPRDRRGPFRPERLVSSRERKSGGQSVRLFRAVDTMALIIFGALCAAPVARHGLLAAPLGDSLPFALAGICAYFLLKTCGLYRFGRQPESVFWNLQQLASCLVHLADQTALIEALNGFGGAYRSALSDSMLSRLGVRSLDPTADFELVNAAFQALWNGGEALRWEPFFFDWFGGVASEKRALSGLRRHLYGTDPFLTFRRQLSTFTPDRPERLASPYFAKPEPEELLYDEIEVIWAAIADGDDWGPFTAKLAGLDEARIAMGLQP